MVGREAVVADLQNSGGRSEAERVAAFARLADRTLAPSYRLAALLLDSAIEARTRYRTLPCAWDPSSTGGIPSASRDGLGVGLAGHERGLRRATTFRSVGSAP